MTKRRDRDIDHMEARPKDPLNGSSIQYRRIITLMLCSFLTPTLSLALPSVETVVEKARESADVQVLVVSELMGYIEPCGCTIDLKLGAIERLDALIRTHRSRGPSAVLTVGSHLHDHAHLKDHSLAQERAKATLIRSILSDLEIDAHLAGPLDRAAGESFYRELGKKYPLPELSGLEKTPLPTINSRLLELEGAKVGVIGLGHQDVDTGYSSLISQSVNALESKGADLLIVMSTAPRASLRRLALEFPQVSLWILGRGAQEEQSLSPVEHNDQSQRSYIVEAGDRGRHLGVIRLYGLKSDGPLLDTVGDRQRELKSLDLKIKMRERFAGMSQSPFAKAGLSALIDQRQKLNLAPLSHPAKRIEYQLIPIDQNIPANPVIKERVEKYQESLAALNMKSASQVKPPPPNGNGYAGAAECQICHPDADEFWKKTRHAHAWKTLVDAKKTFDVECVSCHVTGWQEPGGSALGHTEKLQDVQCESCHGPAAKHAEIGGGESYVNLKVPSETCETCHNHLHSPKFNYSSYRAKIIGPGHGAPLPQ